MHDETIPNATSEQSTAAPAPVIEHLYYEVGGDVLSKPNALCDVLEVLGCPPCCIFCNAPSDADLVEVILKKRGISALKLIGHVPPMRSARALKQVKSGEIACLVMTDVSGQTIDVEDLDIVVNYALPTDPEVYIHRCGHSRPGAKLSKVISLIGALDIANLHYLNKIVEFEIKKGDLPAKEQLSVVKLNSLRKQAVEMASVNDDRLKELANLVLKDQNNAEIVALLLRNTLELLPSLQTASTSHVEREQSFGDEGQEDRGDDMNRDRGGRGNRRGNDRGGRGDDRGNRGGRGPDRRQGSPGQGQGQGRYGDDQGYGGNSGGNEGDDYAQPGARGFRQDDRNDRGGDEDFPRHREPRNYVPPEKHARVYLGHGTAHGLTSDKLQEILAQQCNVQADAVKRAQVRSNYSFFDISDEAADAVVTALADIQFGSEKFFARKAATISVPRAQNAQQGEEDTQGGQQSESESEQQPRGEESQDAI